MSLGAIANGCVFLIAGVLAIINSNKKMKEIDTIHASGAADVYYRNKMKRWPLVSKFFGVIFSLIGIISVLIGLNS